MKKFAKVFMAVALTLFLTVPASAAFKDMWAQVYAWNGATNSRGMMELVEITSGVQFQVLQRNSYTFETLYEYNDNTMTALTNPVNQTAYADATKMKAAGVLSFRVDPGETLDTYVDLLVVNGAGGFTHRYNDFTENIHSIIIDQRPNVVHHGTIWYALGSPTTTYPNEGAVLSYGSGEVDAGVDFLYGTKIHAMCGEVVTVNNVATGADMTVGTDSNGTAGDADGFLADLQQAAANWTVASLTSTGDLLDNGTNYYPFGYIIEGANEQTLSYVVNSYYGSAAGTTLLGGYIHYWFTYTGGL